MIPQDTQLARLRAEIETLREENRQLREALMPATSTPERWRLPPCKERLFRALAAHESVSFDGCRMALQTFGSDVSTSNMKSQISQLRRIIEPDGYRIESVWGRGYRLIEPSMDQVTDTCVRDLRRTSQAMHMAEAAS